MYLDIKSKSWDKTVLLLFIMQNSCHFYQNWFQIEKNY